MTFTIAPRLVPTSPDAPYKILDQDQSKIRLQLYEHGHGGQKGNYVDARIKVPQLSILLKAAEQAALGRLEEYRQPPEVKIFGEPGADGLCPVSKLLIARVPLDRAGAPRERPWVVQIENGRGEKKQGAHRGSCGLAPGARYEPGHRVQAWLSDQDFHGMMYWTDEVVQTFIRAAQRGVMEGWARIRMEEEKKLKGGAGAA